MELTAIEYGYCKVETVVTNQLKNPISTTHGGVLASLVDTATYWAAYASIEEGVGITTIDLNVNIVGSSNSKKLISEGRIIKLGKTLCLAEATVTDENGRLLSQGTSKILVVQGLQTIETAAEKIGYGSLPNEFI